MPVNWNASINAQPTVPANYLVAAIYDASAPNTVVAFIPLPKPYGSTQQITFLNLEFIVYDFKLFEAVTQTPVGTVLNAFSFQPAQGTISTIREDLYLTANITPGFTSGGTTYQDNTLIGWVYDLERVGAGTLQKGVDYELALNGTPENSTLANEWNLIEPGDVIGDQEKFVLHFQPQVTSAPTGGGGSGSSNIIAGTAILDSDIALDNTYMKKACLLQGLTDFFTVTLPPLNTVGDNQIIAFISEGGSHVNAAIAVDGTDSIQYNGVQSEMIIAQTEELWLFKANGVWNVAFADGNFKTVGEIIYSYLLTMPNTYFANGDTVSRITYARLWKTVQSIAVSDTLWNTSIVVNGRTVYPNRGKFTTGDGSSTFRLPMIYAFGNLKAVDSTTRLAGSFEADQVGQFTGIINVPIGNSFSGNPGSGDTQRGGRGSANPNDIVINQTFNTGLETREANIGVYALIRI